MIIEKIVDVTTGEEKFIERELTAQEKAERDAIKAEAAQAKADAEAKAAQRAAILERLGLTEEEAAVLLG
jgi:hypothetical protein